MDWFLYDNGFRHERVKRIQYFFSSKPFILIFLWVPLVRKEMYSPFQIYILCMSKNN